MLSTETLQLCRNLIGQVQLDANSPDLVSQAQTVQTARAEIEDALSDAAKAPAPPG